MTTGAPAPAPPAKPADHVKTAAIMLLVAAVLILVGTVSKNWISAPGSDDIHMGPRGIEACMESRCVDVPVRGLDTDIEVMMVVAMISGFASAGAAGVIGGMAFARQTAWVVVPPRLANVCFGVAALSMAVFLMRTLGESGAKISWAGFPAIGGVIVAAVGLMTLRPHIGAGTGQPIQPMQPYGSQPYQPYGSQPMQPYANQSQPMQPYANQSQPMQPYANQPMQPYASQSQPMQPYASQSQPMQPYASQSQPMQPHANQPMQPYASQSQPMQPHANQPMQPYANQSQPMQPQPHYGSQPHAQQQLTPPAMPPPQPQAVPSCPRCGTQLHFVAQYQRWFCPREQQYV